MKNLPLKDALKLDNIVSGNLEIRGGEYYVKIFSELYDREEGFSLGFVNHKEGIKEAMHVARKYQDLVDVGFYPPGTQFLVARDELDVITIISVMPKLNPLKQCPDIKERIALSRKKAANVLGVKEDHLGRDTGLELNYGWLDHKLYCFDLHVLNFYKILKNGKKYMAMSWV